MTIKQLIIGCLQKLSSKQSGEWRDTKGINNEYVDKIIKIQRENHGFLLGGSIALILGDVLPSRDIGDIDLIVSEDDFSQSNLYMKASESDAYGGLPSVDKQRYRCFYAYEKGIVINILVYERGVTFRRKNITLSDGSVIACHNFDDILRWKEKYNRPKDIQDLKRIMDKACEEAIFGG